MAVEAFDPSPYLNDIFSSRDANTTNRALWHLRNLKKYVKDGTLAVTDYYKFADQLAPQLAAMTEGTAWGNLMGHPGANEFFKRNDGTGQMQAILPFTRTEYASLSEDVLPTQEDINQGVFDPGVAPVQRLRPTPAQPSTPTSPTTPTTPTAPGTQPTTPSQPTQPTDGTNLPGPGQTVTTPAGGVQLGGNTQSAQDQTRIIAEAELAKKLRSETLDQQSAKRRETLAKLAETLAAQQKAAFDEAVPQLAEHANTRGILRSTGFGDILAKEQSKLTRQTSEQLALQGLADRQLEIDPMGAIQEAYLSGREAAIGRGFSLDDYHRQVQTAKDIGATNLPAAPSSSGTKGAVGRAVSGAAALGQINPWLAIPGAIAGGISGGKKGS